MIGRLIFLLSLFFHLTAHFSFAQEVYQITFEEIFDSNYLFDLNEYVRDRYPKRKRFKVDSLSLSYSA
jgi:hypothetical protein